MIKKIPLRKCLATNQMFPKKELLRIVKNKEGQVFVDLTNKANGRGAYLSKSIDALEKAIKTKVLNRALETEIPSEVYETCRRIIVES